MCIQKVFAGDFPRLPYSYDGPSESRGGEAGFLVHNGVSSAEVPGVPGSLSVPWRIFAVQFWQELVAMARRVHIEVRLPMIVAGYSNVWNPHFTLGRPLSATLCDRPPTTPVRPLIWFVPHQVRQ